MANSTTRAGSPRPRRSLMGLLLLALVVRAGVLFVVPGALADDPDGYRQLARNMVFFGTFGAAEQPTAYRPPLYPLMLVPCVAVGGVLGDGVATVMIGGLHVLLGVGTVALTWWLARRCGLRRWAVLAGVLVAFDPILLGQSTLVMTETAAAFLVALAMVALVRAADAPSIWRCVLAGAALGACGLCRPELLLWAGLCIVGLWWLWGAVPTLAVGSSEETHLTKNRAPTVREGTSELPVGPLPYGRGSEETESAEACPRERGHGTQAVAPRRGSHIAVVLLAMLVVLAPWIVRNQLQFGRPIATTTHGGYTLLLANNRSFYDYLRRRTPGELWDARRLGPRWGGKARHAGPADELEADAQAYHEAAENIRAEPGMFARSCLVRAGRLWAVAPHQGRWPARWSIAIGYTIEYVLAAVGLAAAWQSGLRRKGGFWLWAVLLAGSLTAVHAVYWSNMRMRAPLVPALAVAAAAGIAWRASRRLAAQVSATQELSD